MESAISLRRLAKEYTSTRTPEDAFLAVDAIDLDVHENELLVITGPSGCGKSTVLRLIAGLEVPTGGEVYLGGVRVDSLPPRSRNVGLVFQGCALFEHMTVAENIGYGLKANKTLKLERQRRTEELAALMRLEGLEDLRPDDLSGAQRQRVALARALATRPGVLLLDEPFAAVGGEERARLRSDVKTWHRRWGIPTVLATHDQREALELADRVAVMNAGRFEQVDTPLNIGERPATPFVARFVGMANALFNHLGSPPVEAAVSPALGSEPRESARDGRLPGSVVGGVFLGRAVRLDLGVRGVRGTAADDGPLEITAALVGGGHSPPIYPESRNGSGRLSQPLGGTNGALPDGAPRDGMYKGLLRRARRRPSQNRGQG